MYKNKQGQYVFEEYVPDDYDYDADSEREEEDCRNIDWEFLLKHFGISLGIILFAKSIKNVFG